MRFERLLMNLFVFLCLVALPGAAGLAETSTEYKVKAAFLYNFTKFVKWPSGSFATNSEPLTICTLGEPPVNGILAEVLSGKTVDDRPLRARQIQMEGDTRGCQVLFITETGISRASSLLSALRPSGMLIVSEGANSRTRLRGLVMITFLLDSNRVRFLIDNRTAEKSGLIISSRLLSLALGVDE